MPPVGVTGPDQVKEKGDTQRSPTLTLLALDALGHHGGHSDSEWDKRQTMTKVTGQPHGIPMSLPSHHPLKLREGENLPGALRSTLARPNADPRAPPPPTQQPLSSRSQRKMSSTVSPSAVESRMRAELRRCLEEVLSRNKGEWAHFRPTSKTILTCHPVCRDGGGGTGAKSCPGQEYEFPPRNTGVRSVSLLTKTIQKTISMETLISVESELL